MGLGFQGGQNLLRIVPVIESQGGGAVGGDDPAQRAQIVRRGVAEADVLVGDESQTRERQRRSRDAQQDRHQLAADGEVRERHALDFPRTYDLRETQQLGAQGETGRLGRLQVDPQPDFLLDQHETDHPAFIGELILIADGEYAMAFQPRQDWREVRTLRATDEQNLAVGQLLDALGPVYDQRVALHHLATNDLIERRTEGVAAEHAYDNRRARVGERLGRPIHELCEVEQEDRFDLRGRRSAEHSAGGAPATAQQPRCPDYPQAPGPDAQSSHTIFPYTLRLMALLWRGVPNST